MRVAIAMLTFHRPDDLAEVLPLLLEQAAAARAAGRPGRPVEVRIVVVDNDPGGSGAAVISRFDGSIRCVIEPMPGIAAARNRALDETAADDVVVFLDDDERPHEGWLDRLLDLHLATGAVAVAGPVVSRFVGELDPWVAAGAFFQRRRMPTGSRIAVAATNNLLLDRRRIGALGLRFDRRFGLSGADDTYFTRMLSRRGALMLWCDEAVVTDVVPAARMTRDWVVRRAFSSGNSAALVSVELEDRALARTAARSLQAGRGAIRGVGGGARFGLGVLLRSRHHQTRGLRTLARGAGMLAGSLGLSYQEYGLPSQRRRRLRRLGPVA